MPIVSEDDELLEGWLDPYTVVNFAFSGDVLKNWKVIKKIRLFTKLNNLFGEKYEEQRGSPMPKYSFSAGAEFLF